MSVQPFCLWSLGVPVEVGLLAGERLGFGEFYHCGWVCGFSLCVL